MARRVGAVGEPGEVPETLGAVVQRRPPFGDNPDVGVRGSRTQQRILRAALEVFDEVGYHECGVDRITAKAACSRPSFYQYFASKEDLFRVLSGDLARMLSGAIAELDPITADAEGWRAARTWVEAYGELYHRYAPVFRVWATAVAHDELVASGAVRVAGRQIAELAGRIDRRALRVRRPELLLSVLANGVSRSQAFCEMLAGDDRVVDRRRVEDALTDVVHRSLFGQLPGVNVRALVPAASGLPPVSAPALARPDDAATPLSRAGRQTRNELLEAGRRVFAARGYHDARVDDIVELAAVSHGTFYRYFENKQVLFRILAARSGRRVVDAMEGFPLEAADPAGDGGTRVLRQWLRDYLRVYASEGPVIRAWTEAVRTDADLRAASRAESEATRRRLAAFLAPRGFGDVDADAVVLLGLLDRREPLIETGASGSAGVIDAFTRVLRRGLLPAT